MLLPKQHAYESNNKNILELCENRAALNDVTFVEKYKNSYL